MAVITFAVSNAQPFINEQSALVIGKNGFVSSLGVIKPLVTSHVVNSTDITFTLSNLHLLYDDNFNCHILEARDNAQLIALDSQAPNNLIKYYVNNKSISNTAGATAGLPGYQTSLSPVTSNIYSYNVSANTVTVRYPSSAIATAVHNLLLEAPFYVDLYQIVDKRFSSSNTFYVAGDLRPIRVKHNVVGFSSTANLSIGVSPRVKGLIKTYINGEIIPESPTSFTYNIGDSVITHTIASNYKQVDTVVDFYNLPHFETKDDIFIVDNRQTVKVNATSYEQSSAIYNSELTVSDFYKVKLENNLAANTGISTIVNISPDLIADLSSVNTSANTISITYDDSEYDYTYNLASELIYNIIPFNNSLFNKTVLEGNKLLLENKTGVYLFRTTAVNSINRSSPYTSTIVNLDDPPLGQVKNLALSEILFRDRIKGVMSRISGSFDHIQYRNITGYEISYRINLISGTEPHPSGMSEYNTFTVSADGVGSDNKIRFTVNNIDLGNFGNTYDFEVKVTPLSGVYRGIINDTTLNLSGKSARPLPLEGFDAYQTDSTIVFDIDYPKDDQETLNELDILYTEIRYKELSGAITTEEDRELAYDNGEVILLLPHPLTRQEVSIDDVGAGSFTFTAKTVDTSGNESANTSAKNLTITLPSTQVPIAAWNEAEPNTNVVVGIANKNLGQNAFVSYNESDNGGFVYDIDPITSAVLGEDTPSTLTEDSNGTSSGFTYYSNGFGVITSNDLAITSSSAYYISPVRDLGEVVKGSLVVTSTIDTQLNLNWLELSEDLVVGVAEGNPTFSNVLFDADFEIGTVLGYNNSNGTFSFSNVHSTIINTTGNTKIYAVINPGQEVIGEQTAANDTSNIYSFALIAGAINAHAIELSNVYFANGTIVPDGNATASTVLSNLTQAGSSYKIVDLKQFTDAIGFEDFSPTVDTIKNVFVRFSSANVFEAADIGSSKPHGNVNPELFDSTDLEGNWTRQYKGQRRFRYFQVKLEIELPNYEEGSSNAYLNELNYQVTAPRKTFATTVTSSALVDGNIFVDYSSADFYNAPTLITQVLSAGAFTAKIRDLTNEGANVYIINTQNGNEVSDPGIEVVISAVGA